MKLTYCRVSKLAAKVGGTSAFLKEGLRLSVYDLLHGLMLPSGNDAALCLSEHFGRYLMLLKAKANSQSFTKVCEMNPFDPEVGQIFSRKFVR
jgi:D-alanyl-D-alanine carboxypeptidase